MTIPHAEYNWWKALMIWVACIVVFVGGVFWLKYSPETLIYLLAVVIIPAILWFGWWVIYRKYRRCCRGDCTKITVSDNHYYEKGDEIVIAFNESVYKILEVEGNILSARKIDYE